MWLIIFKHPTIFRKTALLQFLMTEKFLYLRKAFFFVEKVQVVASRTAIFQTFTLSSALIISHN